MYCFRNQKDSLGPVTPICIPSFLGGRDRKDCGLRSAKEKIDEKDDA
jgi:hypothetical protein